MRSDWLNRILDTYHEVTIDGHRTFAITDDGVTVNASVIFGSKFETLVKFEQLDSNITKVSQRHSTFWCAVWAVPICVTTASVLVTETQQTIFDFWPGLFLAFTVMAIVVAFITRRLIEYAQFNNHSGIALLTIGRSGPDAEDFTKFVELVRTSVIAKNSG